MYTVYDVVSGAKLGEITQAQLDFLVARLVEESAADQDYYINRATVDTFEATGADPALISLLRGALASREDMDIRWSAA
jgi:hypothetical protein